MQNVGGIKKNFRSRARITLVTETKQQIPCGNDRKKSKKMFYNEALRSTK
jgi:hypothetical protein